MCTPAPNITISAFIIGMYGYYEHPNSILYNKLFHRQKCELVHSYSHTPFIYPLTHLEEELLLYIIRWTCQRLNLDCV